MSLPSQCLLGGLLLLFSLAVGACGYAADDADRDYLKAFCGAIDDFSDALVTGEVTTALDSLGAELRAIDPPASLDEFHSAFIEYVREVSSDSASLATSKAPKPGTEVRVALTAFESDIDECWDPSYFDGRN